MHEISPCAIQGPVQRYRSSRVTRGPSERMSGHGQAAPAATSRPSPAWNARDRLSPSCNDARPGHIRRSEISQDRRRIIDEHIMSLDSIRREHFSHTWTIHSALVQLPNRPPGNPRPSLPCAARSPSPSNTIAEPHSPTISWSTK